MRIGVPEALLFYRYEPFARAFFDSLKADVVYSGPSNRTVLDEGIRSCVDEACLPIKVFQGHVSKLMKECDKVVVPRIMKCEFGDSICPKFAGLPELIGRGEENNRFAFTAPIYLNDRNRLKKSLLKQGKEIGFQEENILDGIDSMESLLADNSAVPSKLIGQKLVGGLRPARIVVLGHPYNIYDRFINMNLLEKLERMGAQVIEGEFALSTANSIISSLIKKPYWMFYRENLCKAVSMVKSEAIDGIIYVSSFCCGTDSITIEMIRSRIGGFPMLILKFDEHTGEAGIDTRIEAFMELLERRMTKGTRYEANFSNNRR